MHPGQPGLLAWQVHRNCGNADQRPGLRCMCERNVYCARWPRGVQRVDHVSRRRRNGEPRLQHRRSPLRGMHGGQQLLRGERRWCVHTRDDMLRH